jgi:hypothetical protein
MAAGTKVENVPRVATHVVRNRRLSLIVIAVALGASGLGGCLSAPSLLVERPRDRVLDEAVTQMWAREIRRSAQPGDWLLSRSYSAVGDAIVMATTGEELSHASMIDPDRGTVIEAVMPAVVEVPLDEFLRRNRYVMVVRPSHLDEAGRRDALDRARGAVGAPFDIGGLVGASAEGAFYCTELVYWASGLGDRDGDRAMLMPGALLGYGPVVYFSGRRDDAQVLRVAGGWLQERTPGIAVRAPSAPAAADAALRSTVDTTATSTGTFDVDGLAIQESGGL